MLTGILAERKIPFEERPLFAEYGGFGSSLHVSLPPGGTPSFILAVPLSFSDDDRRDFPYAVEVALAFIDKAREGAFSEDALSEGAPKTDMLVAFLADEWSALPQQTPNTGLRDLYSRLEVPEGTALIYLDMYGEAGELVIHHGARKDLAPLNLLQPLAQICDTRGIPYSLAIGSNELYKLALADGPPALEFALSRELPTLYLRGKLSRDGNAPGFPTPHAELAATLLDYAASLDMGAENPDYHYLLLRFGGRTVFIPEDVTVLFFLVVAALFFLAALVYSVVFRFRLLIQWKIFLKRSWILFLLYVLLILSLKGAAAFSKPGLGDTGAWLLYGAVAAEILLGVAIFGLFSPLVDLVYIPRRANFYGNASVILAALGILLSALFDITFIPIFVWAFVFTFLGACVKKPPLVWLCGVLTLLLAFSSLRTIVHAGNRRLASLILSGNTPFILYTALITLPFFIIIKRGILLMSVKRALLKQIIPRLLFLAAAAIIFGISAFFVTRNPVRQPELRTIDDTAGDYLRMDVRDRILLERRTLEITLEAPESPLRFNLYLDGTEGDETPVIYAAPMPFRYIDDDSSPNRNSIEFILGEGPPNPFTTGIVLPLDFTGFLRAEAQYWETAPGSGDADYQLRIIRRYPIGFTGP
jgi:hypothetical protein